MGEPTLPGPAGVVVERRAPWPAVHVDMGNPHAVAFVDDLDEPGNLLRPAHLVPAGGVPRRA